MICSGVGDNEASDVLPRKVLSAHRDLIRKHAPPHGGVTLPYVLYLTLNNIASRFMMKKILMNQRYQSIHFSKK